MHISKLIHKETFGIFVSLYQELSLLQFFY